MKITTLSEVVAGDYIIWHPSSFIDKYDILYADYGNGNLVWCGASYDPITKQVLNCRNTTVAIPISLEEAQEYLAALNKKWPFTKYTIRKISSSKIFGLTISLVREIEEDEDYIVVCANASSMELNHTSFKKYVGKPDQEVVILSRDNA
jgi:hypothetical protein